jgi:hypothetical protein
VSQRVYIPPTEVNSLSSYLNATNIAIDTDQGKDAQYDGLASGFRVN